MAMAHDFLKDELQLESQTGRVGGQILATLVGGTLLICSLIAHLLAPRYGSDFHATILAMLSAILLGAPLVWVALKDIAHGHMHMNELVALAVIFEEVRLIDNIQVQDAGVSDQVEPGS